MADNRADRVARLIKPLRVKPGSNVNLARDFDPGYKAGYVKKKDARRIMGNGIAMLCDYQARLAAQDSYGVLVCLQVQPVALRGGHRGQRGAAAGSRGAPGHRRTPAGTALPARG